MDPSPTVGILENILAADGIDYATMDSLDAIDFLLAIEQRFELRIPDEDAEKWRSLPGIAEYIDEHRP